MSCMNTLIPVIEDDYHKVLGNNLEKMSGLTLKYCLDQGIINRRQFVFYKNASKHPDERLTLSERLIVPQVNNIFIYHFEST